MAVFFDISEIYQFAISIEENGERFYREVSGKFSDERIKEIFNFLADEEVKHKETFKGLLEKILEYKPAETYPGEYFAYLKAYAQELIFPVQVEKEIEEKMTVKEVLDFAIRRELDSILYYTEVKNVIPETQHTQLDKIIEQERQHFIKLSNLKKELE